MRKKVSPWRDISNPALRTEATRLSLERWIRDPELTGPELAAGGRGPGIRSGDRCLDGRESHRPWEQGAA